MSTRILIPAFLTLEEERDICELEGLYGDGECDDFCAEPDPDCE